MNINEIFTDRTKDFLHTVLVVPVLEGFLPIYIANIYLFTELLENKEQFVMFLNLFL